MEGPRYRSVLIGVFVVGGAIAASFGASGPGGLSTDSKAALDGTAASNDFAGLAASDRAVVIQTTSCGDTSRSFGSGIALDSGRVLTAAHVVAGAGTVRVEAGSSSAIGEVVGYDTKRDLALVAADLSQVLEDGVVEDGAVEGGVVFGQLSVGDSGRIIGAAGSGSTRFTVLDRTVIEADDVRGSTRSRRAGYILNASTEPGDSGAGVYGVDGALVGIIFAGSAVNEDRSFVVGSSEIEAFLAEREDGSMFRCDPASSKLKATS